MRLTFDLKRDSLKVKFIPPDKEDLVYLIDTGADTPVWCKGVSELEDIFGDVVKLDSQFVLSGFGKEPEIVDVFRIPEFMLTDGTDSIRYENFVLAVTDRPQMNVDMILPSSIFDHMSVTIDRKTSVVYPKVFIEYDKETYPVFFKQISLTDAQKDMLGVTADTIIRDVYSEREIR